MSSMTCHRATTWSLPTVAFDEVTKNSVLPAANGFWTFLLLIVLVAIVGSIKQLTRSVPRAHDVAAWSPGPPGGIGLYVCTSWACATECQQKVSSNAITPATTSPTTSRLFLLKSGDSVLLLLPACSIEDPPTMT